MLLHMSSPQQELTTRVTGPWGQAQPKECGNSLYLYKLASKRASSARFKSMPWYLSRTYSDETAEVVLIK
jgi:hypothetical protein